MKHSIATVSLSGTLYQKLEAISAAGFDGIELFENDLITSPHSPEEIKEYCDDLNLEIMLYQPFRNFEGNPRHELPQHLLRARKKFDLMARMDISKILVCSSVLPNTSSCFETIGEDLFKLAEIAKEYNIEVGYEALAWGSVINSYWQVWEIVKQVNHPNLGIILDSFHTLSIQDNLSLLEEIEGDKITFLQLADGPFLKMDVLPWSRHYRNFPGQGDFNLQDFLAPILKAGYKGPLSLEVFNDQFRASPPKETALDAKRSLCYLESITYKKLKKEAAATPSELISPELPKKIDYQKIAYLEFSAFDESAERLKKWLLALGFTLKGTHRDKNISCYEQGEIQLLINEEIDSYAYAYYTQHGASLSSAAFVVDQPQILYERAAHMHYSILKPKNIDTLQEWHAVWAPDKSLHYFYSESELTNFNHLFTKKNNMSLDLDNKKNSLYLSCQLDTIDHYALALPAESLSSWLLYYRAILDLHAENELSLPELFGSMKSKLLRSQNQKINIPLNLTLDQATQVGRNVELSKGSGIQHIAFSTTNLIEMVKKARSNGIKFLPISDNYYDDLEARFNLAPDFLKCLKSHKILYDQDTQGGSLLHIYTEQFEQRFSFELIERRNNYKDYGSANTPVRIAASYLS